MLTVKRLIVFALLMVKSLVTRTRFVRLTPNQRGTIHFYDKAKRRRFSVESRGVTDSITADQIYTFHDYDLGALRRFAELRGEYDRMAGRGEAPLIVDCGANIGLAARYFAEEFPAAHVVAIEPDRGNCVMAEKNCAHLSNVTVRCAAIGSQPGTCTIVDSSDAPNSFQVQRAEGGEVIDVLTVPALVEKSGGRPLIIKIDIEGFEKDLFAQDTDWIGQFPLMIVELHDWMLPGEANSANFLRAISGQDRDFVYIGENIFSIRNGAPSTPSG